MLEQRKNNYYRYKGTGESFTVEIDPVTSMPESYCNEVIKNCQEIYENKIGQLYCMYSGGIDSEFLMEIFLHQKIPVTPVIVKMKADLNYFDISYALRYCENKNIKPIIFEIDIKKFIESGEIVEIAELCKTSAYQYLSSIKAAMSLDGTIVTGQDEPYIGLDSDTGKWYYFEKEKWCAWARLFDQKILVGTSCPLSWSSETLAAFMLDPTIKNLGNNLIPGKLGALSSRKYVYGRMFQLEDRKKFTGWENIEKESFFQCEQMEKVFQLAQIYDGEYKIEYNDLVKLLCQNI